jgi:lipoprotein-releasing system permease protein
VLPYEYFVGLRYTRAKRRNHFISVISIISMAGIFVGVTALITILSVMNGFQKELRARILGAASHVQITSFEGALSGWEQLAADTLRHPEVQAAAPYVMAQGLLSFDQAVQGAMLRGVRPDLENQVAEFGQKMKKGAMENLRPGEFGIVLGAELARNLGVRVDEKVTVIVPQGQVTAAGLLPRIKQFRVVGLFELGMYEYDSGLALMHLSDAQKLFRLGEQVSGVRLKLRDLELAPVVTADLSQTLRGDLYVTDWTRSHSTFFKAVQLEKRMMFIILTLIIVVAAFNIISTLVMSVTDKQADIAILRTLGASPTAIMKIFVVQGAVIGVIGTVAGVLGGILLTLNLQAIVGFIERTFSVQFLAKDIYYISEPPSALAWSDVTSIGLMSLVLSLLATLYPSYRASRVNPAAALRYE